MSTRLTLLATVAVITAVAGACARGGEATALGEPIAEEVPTSSSAPVAATARTPEVAPDAVVEPAPTSVLDASSTTVPATTTSTTSTTAPPLPTLADLVASGGGCIDDRANPALARQMLEAMSSMSSVEGYIGAHFSDGSLLLEPLEAEIAWHVTPAGFRQVDDAEHRAVVEAVLEGFGHFRTRVEVRIPPPMAEEHVATETYFMCFDD